jgi:uncharacterized protein involved in outer membrane biogenesis
MKALKIILLIVVVLVVLVIALLFAAARYIESPAMKAKILAAAESAIGAPLEVREFNVSVFGGIELRGVRVPQPQPFSQVSAPFLQADAFVFRHSLWKSLLFRRAEIEKVSLEKPVLTLARNQKAEWNYELLGEKPAEPAPTAAPSAPLAVPLDISLSRLVMDDGEIVALNEKGNALARLQGMDLSASVRFSGEKMSGAGKASMKTLAIADSIFVRKIAAPVTISSDDIKLSPLSGKLADGDASGDLILKLAGGFKYVLNLHVKNGDVAKLLEEAGTKRVLVGKLQANAALKGTGGLPTVVGNGRAEIVGGTLAGVPLQQFLATLLQVPALAEIKFGECVMEFSISNNVMQTPVIRLISPHVHVTGNGAVALDDYALNHNLTLALAKGMLDKTPKEIRNVFTERDDGFMTIDFRVWGPYDAPKTDIAARIIRGAGEQLLEKGLRKLLK